MQNPRKKGKIKIEIGNDYILEFEVRWFISGIYH